MHIVLNLAWWAADERRPLASAGEYSSGGTGRGGRGILGWKEKYSCSKSVVHNFLSSHLNVCRKFIK